MVKYTPTSCTSGMNPEELEIQTSLGDNNNSCESLGANRRGDNGSTAQGMQSCGIIKSQMYGRSWVACQICHLRKVRCDADRKRPCTNCCAFKLECIIPKTSQRKNRDRKEKASIKPLLSHADRNGSAGKTVDNPPPRNELPTPLATAQNRPTWDGESAKAQYTKHKPDYPFPEDTWTRRTELGREEINYLRQKGAFVLPAKSVTNKLVGIYFEWVAPIVPVINKTQFMRQYADETNPPSILLLQAILMAGSNVYADTQFMDNGLTKPTAPTFYMRAEALFDSEYETDRVTTIQALVLMGLYRHGPRDISRGTFYWTRVATIFAQSLGMNRSVANTQLSMADKRLWKRIWWTIFTRDRSVAVAKGRPTVINTDYCDVEAICEDDFIEDDDPSNAGSPSPHHIQFFMQYVKLSEIMGLILSQHYSVNSRAQKKNAIGIGHFNEALINWLQHCPREVCWTRSKHFLSALLHVSYYSTVCLVHCTHITPIAGGGSDWDSSLSRKIAFQAATIILSTVETLASRNELRYCPEYMVHSLFSILALHEYQSCAPLVSESITELDISRVWHFVERLKAFFESIFNRTVQGASGKMYGRIAQSMEKFMEQAASQDTMEDQGKTDYDRIIELIQSGFHPDQLFPAGLANTTFSAVESSPMPVPSSTPDGASQPVPFVPDHGFRQKQTYESIFMDTKSWDALLKQVMDFINI